MIPNRRLLLSSTAVLSSLASAFIWWLHRAGGDSGEPSPQRFLPLSAAVEVTPQAPDDSLVPSTAFHSSGVRSASPPDNRLAPQSARAGEAWLGDMVSDSTLSNPTAPVSKSTSLAGIPAAPGDRLPSASIQLSEPQVLDPAAGGAFLTVDEQRVQVEATQILPSAGSPALHVVIIPLPASETPGSKVASSSPGSELASSTVPVPAASRVPAGFSHEEELFRTKWGWAAYDAVRRAAREVPPSAE